MRTLRLSMISFLMLVAAGPSEALTITITLDDVTVDTPQTLWHEAGVALWFGDTTSEDLTPGWCLVMPHIELGAHQGVYIYPARLHVDLAGVIGLTDIEVDVYEAHDAGSTRAFLYHDETVVDSVQSWTSLTQTLHLQPGHDPVDRLAISGHESAVWEIRLIGDQLLPAACTTLSRVKRLFR